MDARLGWEIRTILVDVDDVRGTADRAAVAVGRIVVAAVELIQDEGGTVPADVLDLFQLVMGDKVAGRVTRVRGEQHLSTAGDFLSDLVRMDVVVVVLRERDRNWGDLDTDNGQHTQSHGTAVAEPTHILEQSQHLRVRRIIRDREGEIGIAQDRRNPDQPSTATRHDAHIFPGILTLLPLSVVLVI